MTETKAESLPTPKTVESNKKSLALKVLQDRLTELNQLTTLSQRILQGLSNGRPVNHDDMLICFSQLRKGGSLYISGLISIIEKAIGLIDQDTPIVELRSKALELQKSDKHIEALPYCELLLTIDENDPAIRQAKAKGQHALGKEYERQGDHPNNFSLNQSFFNSAFFFYQEALETQNDNQEDAIAVLKDLVQLQERYYPVDVNEICKTYGRILVLAPADIKVLEKRADFLGRNGNHLEAALDYITILESPPNNVEISKKLNSSLDRLSNNNGTMKVRPITPPRWEKIILQISGAIDKLPIDKTNEVIKKFQHQLAVILSDKSPKSIADLYTVLLSLMHFFEETKKDPVYLIICNNILREIKNIPEMVYLMACSQLRIEENPYSVIPNKFVKCLPELIIFTFSKKEITDSKARDLIIDLYRVTIKYVAKKEASYFKGGIDRGKLFMSELERMMNSPDLNMGLVVDTISKFVHANNEKTSLYDNILEVLSNSKEFKEALTKVCTAMGCEKVVLPKNSQEIMAWLKIRGNPLNFAAGNTVTSRLESKHWSSIELDTSLPYETKQVPLHGNKTIITSTPSKTENSFPKFDPSATTRETHFFRLQSALSLNNNPPSLPAQTSPSDLTEASDGQGQAAGSQATNIPEGQNRKSF